MSAPAVICIERIVKECVCPDQYSCGGSDYKEEKGKSGYECACCDSLIIGAKTREADKALCPPTLSQPSYSTVQ
jgi:hypothetical protein